MNATINLLGNRLQTLMGDVNFSSDFNKALDSPEHLLAIGQHNIKEFQKIEDMDKNRRDRIQTTVFDLLISVLQKEALQKYGNHYGGSIREILYDCCSDPEYRSYSDKLIRSAKEGLISLNLTEEQYSGVSKYFDSLPVAIIDILQDMIMEMIMEKGICWFPQKEEARCILRVKTTTNQQICSSYIAMWDRLFREENENGE